MNKGKHFTRVCLDCGKVMENVAGNLRFCASCRRERHNQYCRDYRARNENAASVMWYTVWDAKTGDLLASGTSEMCPAAGLQEREQLCVCRQPWAQRQPSNLQVHICAGTHRARRSGQPAAGTHYAKKARRCANTDELQGMMEFESPITPMIP